MEERFKIYDNINTTAVRWLFYNAKTHQKKLGISNFSMHNKHHMWMLYMLRACSVYNNYTEYYIDKHFLQYLYLRYIKKFKYLRFGTKNKMVLMIDVKIFVDELICSFNNDKINKDIIEKIVEEYWGGKNNA